MHKQRLQRVQEFLQPRQRAFLELLPLIFHLNHPALPGFISSKTPAGIPDYMPGKRTLSKAATLSKSFDYKKRRLKNHPIHGLYLMGSVGSIAYSKKSDLDIWLCHQGNLSRNELDELQQKMNAIEKWASTLTLEAHFFFINVDEFRHGKGSAISEESCGSTQHHLLLEEFYRTGLYIAGRIPLWWLVPSHQDTTYSIYTKHLLAQRFIDEDEVIDFGGLEKVPAEEFLGASLWHLYKAFKDPHKSLLKLLLMEAYATEYPRTKWLSLELKEAVYSGQFNPDDLDPYILMYEKVEHYLLSMEANRRLDLARECFYININELLSRESVAPRQQHRREALQKMITKWGWAAEKIAELDGRKLGGIEKFFAERNLIAQELIDGYQLLNRFAGKHTESHQPNNHEIKLLGRKLQALLEKKPGKVEIVNPYNNNRAHQQELHLTETKQASGATRWAVHLDHLHSSPPLAKARYLTELLGWIVLNGLYGSNTHVALRTQNS
ncbi:MAG: class I adenylate cyclase, partial [Methylococcales bacterium]